MRRDLLLLAGLVLLIRLPFLAQPIQGDDVYYLAMARNGLVDPLHPMQMGYVYQGQHIWMAGHSHPPLNNYILLLLLKVFGGVHEAAFHAVYIVFSLLAVGAVYFLGRRLTPRPLAAALLFLAVPAFVLSGNKLEADLPFLAFWLLGFALFVYERPLWAVVPLALSGLGAYQSVFAAPILAWWFWKTKPGGRWGRRQWPYAVAILAPLLLLAAWQAFEMASGAAMPAAQLAGYHTSWHLGGFARRARSGLALTIHLGWFLFPVLAVFVFRLRRWVWTLLIFAASTAIAALATEGYTLGEKALVAASLGVGLCVLVGALARLYENRATRKPVAEGFLAAWVVLFFAAALFAFYAGAARYLLPLAAPLALLAARNAAKPLLAAGVAVQLAFSLLLATAYYQYVSQYRDFAARLEPLVASRRLWFNADWGLRYYLEAIGGEAVLADRPLLPQAALVSSRLGGTATVQTLGQRRELLRAEIRTGAIPLTVVGVDSHSGNASAGFGLLPFDYGRHLLDEVVAEVVGASEPTASYLTMAAPEADKQLLLGFYQLEQNQWRWIGPRAMAVLLAPDTGGAKPGGSDAARDSRAIAVPFELAFHIPEAAPARRVTVQLDGRPLASETYLGPGGYTLRAAAMVVPGRPATVEISVDRAFRVAGDSRELGIIVSGLGFVQKP
jgi:4-amino-4-deoxy-L-arabinose transferase-like glycosyltransferase